MPAPIALATSVSLFLPTPEATEKLGAWLAAALHPGDVILLHGEIGAGKTHLARALIRARLGRMVEVPSPTFTLIQTYDADDAEIWHADLYRLSHPDEVVELGLEAAFDTAICLIEWPDRLGDLTPDGALHLTFSQQGEGRRVVASSTSHSALLDRLAREWGADV